TDTTFFAGPDSVQYTIQGQRADATGPLSEVLTVNFGRAADGSIQAVGTTGGEGGMQLAAGDTEGTKARREGKIRQKGQRHLPLFVAGGIGGKGRTGCRKGRSSTSCTSPARGAGRGTTATPWARRWRAVAATAGPRRSS